MSEQQWADGLTPELLERIVVAAIQKHEWDDVEAAMKVLAVRDPHRAEGIYEAMRLGLALNPNQPAT